VEKAGFFIGTMVVTLDSAYLNSNDARFIPLEEKATTDAKEIKISVLNKGYVTQKEFKKLEKKYAKNASYSSLTPEVFHYKLEK
jgi:hypothetical protein